MGIREDRLAAGNRITIEDEEEPTIPEYALQVVPVGELDPSQLIGGLRAPPGFEPDAIQIMAVELTRAPSIDKMTMARAQRVSAVCFTWKKLVPLKPAAQG